MVLDYRRYIVHYHVIKNKLAATKKAFGAPLQVVLWQANNRVAL